MRREVLVCVGLLLASIFVATNAEIPRGGIKVTAYELLAPFYTDARVQGFKIGESSAASIDFKTNDYILFQQKDKLMLHFEAKVKLPHSSMAFRVTADDGVRVSVNGDEVLDAWQDQGATTFNLGNFHSISTTGDNSVDFEIDYYNLEGEGTLILEWSSNTTAGVWETVPTSAFISLVNPIYVQGKLDNKDYYDHVTTLSTLDIDTKYYVMFYREKDLTLKINARVKFTETTKMKLVVEGDSVDIFTSSISAPRYTSPNLMKTQTYTLGIFHDGDELDLGIIYGKQKKGRARLQLYWQTGQSTQWEIVPESAFQHVYPNVIVTVFDIDSEGKRGEKLGTTYSPDMEISGSLFGRTNNIIVDIVATIRFPAGTTKLSPPFAGKLKKNCFLKFWKDESPIINPLGSVSQKSHTFKFSKPTEVDIAAEYYFKCGKDYPLKISLAPKSKKTQVLATAFVPVSPEYLKTGFQLPLAPAPPISGQIYEYKGLTTNHQLGDVRRSAVGFADADALRKIAGTSDNVRMVFSFDLSFPEGQALRVSVQGGVQVYIDGEGQLKDSWEKKSATYNIALKKFNRRSIMIEYFNTNGDAMLQLQWRKLPSKTTYTNIPPSAFAKFSLAPVEVKMFSFPDEHTQTLLKTTRLDALKSFPYSDPTYLKDLTGRGSYVKLEYYFDLNIPKGTEFKVEIDDGLQVVVDGVYQIQGTSWQPHGGAPFTFTPKHSGRRSFVVYFFNHKGPGELVFYWKRPTDNDFGAIPSSSFLAYSGGSTPPVTVAAYEGYLNRGSYINSLRTYTLPPMPDYPPGTTFLNWLSDNFGRKLDVQVYFYFDIILSQKYNFRVEADDGVWIDVDGQRRISGAWKLQGGTYYSFSINKGRHSVSIGYFNHLGGGTVHVQYEKGNNEWAEIPASWYGFFTHEGVTWSHGYEARNGVNSVKHEDEVEEQGE